MKTKKVAMENNIRSENVHVKMSTVVLIHRESD